VRARTFRRCEHRADLDRGWLSPIARPATRQRRLLSSFTFHDAKAHPTVRDVFVDGVFHTAEDRLRTEEHFFGRLRLPNGLFKTTATHRFDDINPTLLDCIRRLWPDEQLEVLDVAVASGITTLELADAMRKDGRSFRILATDAYIEGSLLSYGRRFEVLLDPRGRVLHFDMLGYPVANYLGTGVQFCRRFVPVFLGRVLFRVLRFTGIHRLVQPTSTPIRLLTGRWHNERDVTFIEEDLFAAVADRPRFHIIRAANVLNPSVFSRAELERAIDLLRVRLRLGGILCIIRSHLDGSNHGAVYGLRDGSFCRVATFGEGCELEAFLRMATDRSVTT
jgi:hypothetical protein